MKLKNLLRGVILGVVAFINDHFVVASYRCPGGLLARSNLAGFYSGSPGDGFGKVSRYVGLHSIK